MEQTDKVYYRIRCEYCQAYLPFANGEYGACPVCHSSPEQAYIDRQTYLLSRAHGAILLAWNPGMNDLVFTHPHSDHIPRDSALVLNANQAAAFYCGGNRAILTKATTYALSDEDPNPDIAGIVREIRAGNAAGAPHPLHTKVIFFDTRKHELRTTVDAALPGGRWGVRLPVCVFYQLDPGGIKTLLSHALNLDKGETVVDKLQNALAEGIGEAISSAFEAIPAERLKEAVTEDDVTALIHALGLANAVRHANQTLLDRWGLLVESVTPITHEITVMDAFETVECPFPRRLKAPNGKISFDDDHPCGARNLVRKNARAPFVCKACGRKVRWCVNCSRYTSDHKLRAICDFCSIRYTTL